MQRYARNCAVDKEVTLRGVRPVGTVSPKGKGTESRAILIFCWLTSRSLYRGSWGNPA